MRRMFLPLELKDDQQDFDQLGFECELKFLPTTAGIEDGQIEGYGAIFNSMDNGGDIILPGAFKATLADWRKRKSMPPMLWQHRTGEPIGVWTDLEEDDKGLAVKGELILEVPQALAVRALAKRGAVKGLSIGYVTRDADINRVTGVRKIKQLDLYEISPVTIPMQPKAGITGVKSDFLQLSDREQEKIYREGGLSQREAKMAVAANKRMAQRDAGPEPGQSVAGSTGLILTMRAAALRLAT